MTQVSPTDDPGFGTNKERPPVDDSLALEIAAQTLANAARFQEAESLLSRLEAIEGPSLNRTLIRVELLLRIGDVLAARRLTSERDRLGFAAIAGSNSSAARPSPIRSRTVPTPRATRSSTTSSGGMPRATRSKTSPRRLLCGCGPSLHGKRATRVGARHTRSSHTSRN